MHRVGRHMPMVVVELLVSKMLYLLKALQVSKKVHLSKEI